MTGDTEESLPPVPPWSDEKLDVLRCYLGVISANPAAFRGGRGRPGGFMLATRSARARYYVDLFAGSGRGRHEITKEAIDTSPALALKAGPPEFTAMFWVEKDPTNIKSLQVIRDSHPDKRITILEGDANERVDDLLRLIPHDGPVLTFLDPWSTQLDWRTVELLAERNATAYKFELLILFAYNMSHARLMPRDPSRMTEALEAKLDAFMPSPERWRKIYLRRPVLTADEYRRAILGEYLDGLRRLGYRYVPEPRLIHDYDRRPLYFLVFATSHEAGERVMTHCFSNVRPQGRRQRLPGL
ncbi:MAG: three-Cys-motif partner protein TcmP [Dehalococcoidia bacterium]